MQIVIVGAGTVGFDLAFHLRRSGHDIAVVEIDPERCAEIASKLDVLVIEGAGTSPEALERAGLRQAQMVLAVTSVDEVNLIVCGLAAQFNVESRIARVRNREYTSHRSWVDLASLGVTRVINPERIVVRVIDQIARIPDVREVFGYHEGQILIARHVMTPQMPVVGKSLHEIIQIAGSDRFLSVALRRKGEARIPVGSDVLQPGDDLTTLFPHGSLPKYLDLLGLAGKRVRKAVVAGDGLTALLLSETLRTWVEDVTLVDRDPYHGELAARRLDDVDVIHGEPTERDVLREVNVAGADLFVGAGRDTPQNVMSGLLARAEGVARVIAVSYEPQNNRLYRRIGVHYVVSPRRAMTQEIVDIIHRGRRSMELQLRDMPLQSIELRADPGSRITRAPLVTAWQAFKGRAIVGAVVRNGETRIPRGDTQIEAGDDVIVVAEPKVIGKIQRMFGGR